MDVAKQEIERHALAGEIQLREELAQSTRESPSLSLNVMSAIKLIVRAILELCSQEIPLFLHTETPRSTLGREVKEVALLRDKGELSTQVRGRYRIRSSPSMVTHSVL